jgi:aspartyl-tRNA(Asn)/glutamyl-tRNA(Gln) amidotransferase subunit A
VSAVPQEPCDLTIREAARLLRSRALSSVELVTSVLHRLAATEPHVHAYVVVLEHEALATARAADVALSQGQDLGPLHGIPVAIKDIIDVAGVPTRCGSRVRQDVAPAASDAPCVARLRAAGAVIVGKTTTQEFAAGVVSPPARNPWDPSRIPGGSSGGSAVAVSLGSALAALGSDTGGSIRIPAALCGVAGLKPTFGAVETAGVVPLAWSLDTVGPLARTVADAALVYDVIAEPGRPSALTELSDDLHGVRIGVPRSHFFDRLQPGVAAAVEHGVRCLQALGAEIVDVTWPEAGVARAASFVINRVESVAVHARTLRATPDLYGDELRLRLESAALFPAERYLQALQARTLIRAAVARVLRDNRLDALVAPATPGTAVPADDLHVVYEDGSREPVGLAYTRLTMPFNLTGQPALSVPCGVDDRGLPVGLQLAGRPGGEARLCRIGAALEGAITLPRPPLVRSAEAGSGGEESRD